MKPALFEYERVDSLDSAVEILERVEGAKVLAGGQSLIPMLNIRLTQPSCLVDLGAVDSLAGLRWTDQELVVGAMTRQRTVERDPEVARRLPVLREAVRWIGHATIRNRGTIGGSLAHADPAAELPVVAAALGATFVARGPAGDRTIPVGDFFKMFLTTDLEPNEILHEVRLPLPPAHAAGTFVELARRSGDFALVSVMAVVGLDDHGAVDFARIAAGGVGPVPMRFVDAEAALVGRAVTDAALADAGSLAAAASEPFDDNHGSAGYRRHLLSVLVGRAVRQALDRAQGTTNEGMSA